MTLFDQLLKDRDRFIVELHERENYTDNQLAIIFNMDPVVVGQILDHS